MPKASRKHVLDEDASGSGQGYAHDFHQGEESLNSSANLNNLDVSSSSSFAKRKKYDSTMDKAVAITGRVALSIRDKATEIMLSDDQMTCIGCGGYRMVRATHGVHNGLYYWEAEILQVLAGWLAGCSALQPRTVTN